MSALQKAKGPAEVAASAPSHGSQSRKGNTNMDTNSTAAADTATITVSFDIGITSDMDVCARRALYDAFYLASEAIQGVMSQPRCYEDNDKYLNSAGCFLDHLSEFFGHCTDALIKSERERKDVDPGDNERRLYLLLRHGAQMCDDLPTLAAMASRFVVEQNDCERDAKHGRKALAA